MSVVTKLGLDLAEFSRGWNRAETIAATGAAGVGKAVEKKLGAQDAYRSFVAAVGIDVAKIANFIAESFGVGERQQKEWQEFADLSDRVAEANLKNMRANLTEEQRYQLALRDRDTLLKRISEREVESTRDQIEAKKDELALSQQIADIQAYEAKVAKERAEQSRRELEARIDLNEKEHDAQLANVSTQEKISRLRREITALEGVVSNQGPGVLDADNAEKLKGVLQKRKGDLITAEKDLEAESQKRAEKRADLLADRAKVAASAVESRSGLATAIEDRGKLTLAELANIGAFQAGVSTDVTNQAGAARDVLALQRQAEEARLGGRAQDAIALLSQADKLKGGLSALNSGERADPFKAYKAALSESEQKLTDIDRKLAGKFVNQ